MTWKCRAISVTEGDLFDPSIVPFSPTWTVGFNSRFFAMDPENEVQDDAFKTGEAVIAWKEQNASQRMEVYGSGEVICENETDAMMLFLAFR